MQILINGFMHFVAAGATDPAQYPQWSPGYIRWVGINGGNQQFRFLQLTSMRYGVPLDFMLLTFYLAYLTREW